MCICMFAQTSVVLCPSSKQSNIVFCLVAPLNEDIPTQIQSIWRIYLVCLCYSIMAFCFHSHESRQIRGVNWNLLKSMLLHAIKFIWTCCFYFMIIIPFNQWSAFYIFRHCITKPSDGDGTYAVPYTGDRRKILKINMWHKNSAFALTLLTVLKFTF